MQIQLTVFHDGSLWVGLFERRDGATLSVARVVFGAEPTTAQLYEWLSARYPWTVAFREVGSGEESAAPRPARNPKRAQREARRSMAAGVPNKAHEAMRLALEAGKVERKEQSRAEREAEKERRFELRQAKRKEKHRGR